MNKLASRLMILAGAISLPGSALAYSSFLSDVNDSCGYEVMTDCQACHDTDKKAPTYEKDLYLSEGACGFCTENQACVSGPPTEDELLADARAVTLDYFETLFSEFMSHLQGAINDDVPGNPFAEVFPACPEIAPVIASDKSRASGYLVRRVTERTRNSRNIPDEWELLQLRNFAALAASKDPSRVLMQVTKPDGGTLNSLEYEAYEVVEEAETGKGKNKIAPQAYFRYIRSLSMPPLPVAFGGPDQIPHPISGDPVPNPNLPCLLCHGSDTDVPDVVKTAISENYPYDKAMDYKAGDIRGAWSIKIPLNQVPQ